MEQISVDKYIRDSYKVVAKDVETDNYQTGRAFCGMYDGLKISYRHYLQVLLQQPDKMIKVQSILGDTMKQVHFHGDLGAQEVIYSLQNDYNMVEVQGSSGSRNMSETFKGAAGRYTECRLKPILREQLEKLMPYVPCENTITGAKERRFIPTPIPLNLTASGSGVGVGIRNVFPAFTPSSIYNAFKKNDPLQLRLKFGYTLGDNYNDKSSFNNTTNEISGDDVSLNKTSADNEPLIKELWEKGEGSLIVRIPVYKCTVNKQDGFMLVCDPALYKPKISKKIEEWEAEGLVDVFDYSDVIGKLFIGLTPRTRKLTIDELKNEVLKAKGLSWSKEKYEIKIATEDKAGPVNLYSWIGFTMKTYKDLYNTYIKDQLLQLDKEEIAWYNMRAIADLLNDKKTKHPNKDIVDIINAKLNKGTAKDKKHLISIEHVELIGAKAISTLRDADPDEKLKKIDEQRKAFNAIDIESEIKKFVKCLEK